MQLHRRKAARTVPGRRPARIFTAVAVATALLAVSACSSSTKSSASSATSTGVDQRYVADMTYWYWGESDIPGIDKWMKDRAAQYHALHPQVNINVVSQSSDTLIGGFRLAAQSKSGPDLATQWATLPVLTPYWNGNVAPISDYVPASETSQWVNAAENAADGKTIAMPLYLMGIPLVWNKQLFTKAGLDPEKPPVTWSDLLADSAALKAHGITPFGMGNKDGFFGAWMFSIFAKQALGSLTDIEAAIGNTDPAAQPKLSKILLDFYTAMQDLKNKGYLNANVSSLDLTQGWQLFPQGKVAMSLTTDGNAMTWSKTLGVANVGVTFPPKWGNGALSSTYDVTQSSSQFITSWTKNKPAAATFLAWLHQPANLTSLYTTTGAFPADKRFDVATITDPMAKQLYQLDTAKSSIWLENYLPPQVDTNADMAAGQLILSGSGGPTQAVALWERVINQWRTQQAGEYAQYQKWAKSNG
jgi:raffinose/stachyose/melibiose transport system substrate-binding protein